MPNIILLILLLSQEILLLFQETAASRVRYDKPYLAINSSHWSRSRWSLKINSCRSLIKESILRSNIDDIFRFNIDTKSTTCFLEIGIGELLKQYDKFISKWKTVKILLIKMITCYSNLKTGLLWRPLRNGTPLVRIFE